MKHVLWHWTDSVTASCGFRLSVGDVDAEAGPTPVRFIAESDPENWTMLDALVQRDTVLSRADRERYMALEAIQDPDLREKDLQKLGGYRYMREHLYPRGLENEAFLLRDGLRQYRPGPDSAGASVPAV